MLHTFFYLFSYTEAGCVYKWFRDAACSVKLQITAAKILTKYYMLLLLLHGTFLTNSGTTKEKHGQ